jgi:hypothetical protein
MNGTQFLLRNIITSITLFPPNTTSDTNFLSIAVAATVQIQGATLVNVSLVGPSFPAEQTTVIPFSTAWKAPMAIEPSDNDSISTPSSMASLNAANIQAPFQCDGIGTQILVVETFRLGPNTCVTKNSQQTCQLLKKGMILCLPLILGSEYAFT